MKNINYIILIVLSILFCNFAEAQTDFTAEKLIRKGNKEFTDSNFTAAEEQYQLAVLEDRSNFKAKYNLANTLFKQERFEEAAEAYEDILDNAPDNTMKANIYHNMANSKLANKDLEGSIADYKNALRLEPKMQDTRYNLTYAMKLKEQQDQQEKQENKDENKDNKDQDKKDQDKEKKEDEKKDQDKDKKDQDKKDEEKKDQDKDKEKKEDEDKKDKDGEEADDENKDEKNQKPEESEKKKADKKETERLLRAVAEKEKDTKEKLEKKKARVKAVKTEKDW